MSLGKIKTFPKKQDSLGSKICPGSVVEYEQHGKSMLAAALIEKKGKWSVLNLDGGTLDLPANRLFLLGKILPENKRQKPRALEFLTDLSDKTQKLLKDINLKDYWELLFGEVKEFSVEELCKLIFNSNDAASLLATRRALVLDTIYFKRKKNNFEPRDENAVEQLTRQAQVLEQKRKSREKSLFDVLDCLQNKGKKLPANIEKLEMVATLGKRADQDKQIAQLLDEVNANSTIDLSGKLETQAFNLLVALKHFSPNQNLTPIRLGRPIRFSEIEKQEAKELDIQGQIEQTDVRTDLRHLFAITIDAEETKDCDDAISLEKLDAGYRLGVHITDVASLVCPDSALDKAASRRATSIYCADQIFPMLPPAASEGLLSLIEGSDRPCVSILVEFDRDAEIQSSLVCLSTIQVSKRLTYQEVDALLFEEQSSNDELSDLLVDLWTISRSCEAKRIADGAVQFERREMLPVISRDNIVSLIENDEDTPARKLISEIMILANATAASIAHENSVSLLYRSQEEPDKDIQTDIESIPDGPAREFAKRGTLKRSSIVTQPARHSSLGLNTYAQVTSPIRRMVDLVNQRQLVHWIKNNKALYDEQELQKLLEGFELGMTEATNVLRSRSRFWLLRFLEQQKVNQLDATIVKIAGPKPLAELDILYSLFPFHPAKPIKASDPKSKSLLGKRVVLKIERINARTESLLLKEIANS